MTVARSYCSGTPVQLESLVFRSINTVRDLFDAVDRGVCLWIRQRVRPPQRLNTIVVYKRHLISYMNYFCRSRAL